MAKKLRTQWQVLTFKEGSYVGRKTALKNLASARKKLPARKFKLQANYAKTKWAVSIQEWGF